LERLLASETSQENKSDGAKVDTLEGEASDDFNRVLAEAIEKTISALLGQRVLAALYEHLKKHHSITSDALPAHLKTLHDVLQHSLGFAASTTVERAIARALYSRLNMRFRSTTNLTLLEYVDEAKRNLAAEQSRSRS
jgi:hypothetical protein